MENVFYSEIDKVNFIQSKVYTDFTNFVINTVSYILNPQWKLPPKLKDHNLWYIFASSLPNLAAEVDFDKWIVSIDKDRVKNNYGEVQDLFELKYNPDNNLTYYPLHMIKPSNSSKFVHWLPYIDILEKWENEFDRDSEKLKSYIEKYRDKLHIDSDVNIVSARVVWRSIHLRISNWKFDVTIPLWYSTKREKFYLNDDKSIELVDPVWNIFSPQWVDSIEYYFTDEEIKENVEKAHKQKSKYMLNFFAWRAPEYVTEENYKRYYYHEIDENILDDEDIFSNHSWVVHHFKSWKIVVIEQVNDKNWNYLSTTQDQILPNYWNKYWTEEEKDNFNYWKNIYQRELHRLIDLWVDCFRIDLAHGFRKNNNCKLLDSLIFESIKYARAEYGKNIYFVLETYDFSDYWWTKPATFRDWNINLPYSAVKVYHKDIEDKLANLKEHNWLENFMSDLTWLFQDLRWIYGEMPAFSTFDDFNLKSISEKSWIKHIHILEMQLLLWKAWFNILSLDRDFLWEEWELIPTVPWWAEEIYWSWKFKTHKFLNLDELQKHIEKDILTIYNESDSVKLLEELSSLPTIKWLYIDKNDKKLIFVFDDNTKRVFDFPFLMNDWRPYTISSNSNLQNLSEDLQDEINKLEEQELLLVEKYKNCVFDTSWEDLKNEKMHIYNHDFWIDFSNFIKLYAWEEHNIEQWDTYKQEAYFLLNRERLVKKFMRYKNINIIGDNIWYLLDDSDEITVLQNIYNIKLSLKLKINNLLKNIYLEAYPDLFS